MKRPRFFNIAETLSGAVCLISVIAIGILMMRGGKRARQYRLFGWRAVVRGTGGGRRAHDRDADDFQDLRLCVDGAHWLFRHETEMQIKEEAI